MPARVISGKQVAAEIRQALSGRVEALRARGVVPGLGVILVGDDPASHSYVKSKEKACHELTLHSVVRRMPAGAGQQEVIAQVEAFNGDPAIHGILVQLPLPDQIDEQAVILAIRPEKDVDGFHPVNVGNLHIGSRCFVPCTPAGVMELIDRSGFELKGTHAVVVGRSNIVGKPVAMLLLSRHSTVTMCHSRTRDLPAVTRTADVLVAAVGKAELIKGDWIKPGAVVIDVGVNRLGDRLVGDVDFASASPVAGFITPVPGGVGPMTITMLIKNSIEAAERTLG
ncbi:MAG TPA: bifunctional methylenetetrahydrofolate dehydrogenase/methenyltetrahydrofolate cyclohydrolase FolD [Bacillota bacterium]|nr:bifunctional methylenetetrahydrofolate dehydrogenase/methenyltetrahydrofolate cyclohydrolase FolD [Bacillota bacterium]